MNILDRLTQLRQSTTGCATVALSDLSTGIVLCSSSIVKLPQDRVDLLAKTALRVFDPQRQENTQNAIVITPQNTQFYVRSATDQDEILCSVCTPGTDTAQFLFDARNALTDIASAP